MFDQGQSKTIACFFIGAFGTGAVPYFRFSRAGSLAARRVRPLKFSESAE